MGMILLLALVPVALAGLFAGGDDDPEVVAALPPDEDGGGDDGGSTGGGNGEADVLIGGPRANVLTGDAEQDLIAGFAENDTLSGLGGNDLIVGDSGADSLSGGDGADLLLGGTGNDTLNGGADDDALNGGTGDDVLDGGDGDDYLIDVNGGDPETGGNILRGGAGNDVIVGWKAAPGTARDPLSGADPNSAIIAPMEEVFGSQTASFNQMIRNNSLTTDNGRSFDRMEGGTGDDTLLGDRGDLMLGGEGADVFSVLAPPQPDDPDDAGFGFVAGIADFEPGLDRLQIQTDSVDPFTLRVDADQDGLWIVFNGRDVALLTGLQQGDVVAGDIEVLRLTA
ncbi:MAG: hypothetical protein H9533_13875 [Rhodobacteraceae bacterium]|nr:hypothetical protein [Paracoccaceae bacterium]